MIRARRRLRTVAIGATFSAPGPSGLRESGFLPSATGIDTGPAGGVVPAPADLKGGAAVSGGTPAEREAGILDGSAPSPRSGGIVPDDGSAPAVAPIFGLDRV
jgi:hypothetical protein